jgi:hypothetical protein
MGSFGAGISQVGAAWQEAKELRRQDALRNQQAKLAQDRFGLEKDRFAFEKSQASRPSYKGFAQVGGKLTALVQDPSGAMRVQTFDTLPQDAFSAATLKAIEGIKDPALKQAAQDEAGMYLSQGDTKGAFGAVKSRVDKAQADAQAESRKTEAEKFARDQQSRDFAEREKLKRMGKSDGTDIPASRLKALADKWHNEGIKPPAKYQAAVEEYMEDNKLTAKVKLTSQEQALKDVLAQIEPKVAQLEKTITDNKLQNKGGMADALSSKYQFSKYRMGMKPDQVNADVIKAAAALQVMGAAPWMRIGRGKYTFEVISQHLPHPGDSPALLYDKAQFLKGIVDEARQALPDSGAQGGADIDSVLDDVFGKRGAH